jgi:hypothetical protein
MKSSTRRWVLFEDIITRNGYKVIFQYIKGKDNTLPDIFSWSSILQERRKEQALSVVNILVLELIIS